MNRINSIDFTRGLVMVIMALDHVRDLFHINSLTQNPVDLNTTTAGIFATRWITHLCAPTFVFLSGTSAYLVFKRNNDLAKTKHYLRTRGLWLILLEFTVINFILWTDIYFRILVIQVIFAIGLGFIVLSFLLKVSPRILAIAGLAIIFGHNLLQGVFFEGNNAAQFVWAIFFRLQPFQITPNFNFTVLYPLIPWWGILLTGFAAGKIFELPLEKRKKIWLQIGLASLSLFCLIRLTNVYGDPAPWAPQKTALFTFFSFMNVNKYPPSLLYALVTLGIMSIILSLSDGVKNRVTDFFSTYGKVPLFYYLAHWYIIHPAMFIMVFLQGFTWDDLEFGAFKFGRPAAGSGVELPVVYLVWLGIVLLLYPLCKWYGRYKAAHPENWLLRYI